MPRALRFLPILAIFAIAIFLLTVNRPAHVAAVTPGAEYKLWGTYWTVEPGFTSTLEMKNNRVGESLTARVSLYFLNGKEFELDSVVLGPRQTVVIDLNEVHKALPASIAARAGKEGTVEVEFVGPNPSAIMGSVSVTNPRRGIAWNFFLYPERLGLGIAPVRGLFWFPDHKADGFVAVQNLSAQAMTVTLIFTLLRADIPSRRFHFCPDRATRSSCEKH